MKKLIFNLCLLSVTVNAQNLVCLEIEPNPNSTDAALSAFTKYVNVLNCFEIYAEENISDAKVLHAAAVAAELLDNNEDGIVDDLLIKNQLAASSALMPLLAFEGSVGENTLFSNYEGEGISAVLYNEEIDPTQPGHWGSDATVEEIIHTINHVGHTNVYPEAFSMTPSSSLMSAAMDVARGGQFMTIPSTYPEEAWYHYDDYTCDYECMAIEYIYWSIVSNMGILNDAETCSGIANEWELCSPELFQSIDVLMYELITNPQYLLPTNAPDGNYCPEGVGVEELLYAQVELFPNPCENSFSINSNQVSVLNIYSINATIVYSQTLQPGENNINIERLKNGMYIVLFNGNKSKLLIQ